MAKYKDSSGRVIEVGSPEFNKDLIAGMTPVSEDTPLGRNTLTSSDFQDQGDVPFNEARDPSTVETFTTPSGAVVDSSGNLVSTPQKEGTDAEEGSFAAMAEDEFSRILGINQQLSGRADFEAEQREKEGVTNLTTLSNDLQAQLEGLNLKSQGLVNKFNNVEFGVQIESEGRGRTHAGVEPLTAARKREIAFEQSQIASQALMVQAEFAAVQGNLANARLKVQEAVDAKYGGLIQAKQDAIDNLKLLKDSGILSREEERRANAQIKKEEAEKLAAEDAKNLTAELELSIIELMPEIKKVANSATLIQKMKEAGSVSEALSLAADAGVDITGGPDLTGTSTDLRTFSLLNPNLKVGTPEFKAAFETYVSSKGGGKTGSTGGTPTIFEATGKELSELLSIEFADAPELVRVVGQTLNDEQTRYFLYDLELEKQAIDRINEANRIMAQVKGGEFKEEVFDIREYWAAYKQVLDELKGSKETESDSGNNNRPLPNI